VARQTGGGSVALGRGGQVAASCGPGRACSTTHGLLLSSMLNTTACLTDQMGPLRSDFCPVGHISISMGFLQQIPDSGKRKAESGDRLTTTLLIEGIIVPLQLEGISSGMPFSVISR
jgi:hypothetical protein